MSRQRRVPTPPEESHRSAPAGNPGVIQTEETQTSPAEVTESPNPDRQVRGQVRVASGRTPTSAPRTSRNYDDRRKNASPRYRKRASSLEKKKAKAGWLFVLPFALGFLIVYLPIIYNSIVYSFTEISPSMGGGYTLRWVGFENYYEALFVDASFVSTLTEGVKQLIFDIPAIVIFSLFMAILLNQKMAGRAAFRAIFFVPVILSTGLIDSIDSDNKMLEYMSSSTGNDMGGSGGLTASASDITSILSSMSLGDGVVAFVVGLVNDIYSIVNRSGVQMLIFLAGLQSISPSIYESSQIEGATPWETFWKITFPMITPMILVNFIYTIIDELTNSNNSVMEYISDVFSSVSSSGTGGREVSSAMAWMYFLIVLLIVGVVAAIVGSFVFYQRRED